MSHQLTRPPRRGRLLAGLRQLAVVVGVFAVAGVVAGVVWQWLWTPAEGVVLDHQLLLDGEGLRSDFSGTALYVLVAAATGLVASVGVSMFADRHEVVTLAGVAVGSVLAAWLMYRVGVALGPPDPTPLARAADDNTRLLEQLHVEGTSPFTVLPGGALVGLVVVFVGLGRRQPHHH